MTRTSTPLLELDTPPRNTIDSVGMLSALTPKEINNNPSRARLLPINLEDAVEYRLLFDQRVLCGWSQDEVSAWRE
jgi:hypothetical protein